MHVIRAATSNAAKLLRIDGQVGTLEPGKVCDLVALRANPLEDIRGVRDVAFVVRTARAE